MSRLPSAAEVAETLAAMCEDAAAIKLAFATVRALHRAHAQGWPSGTVNGGGSGYGDPVATLVANLAPNNGVDGDGRPSQRPLWRWAVTDEEKDRLALDGALNAAKALAAARDALVARLPQPRRKAALGARDVDAPVCLCCDTVAVRLKRKLCDEHCYRAWLRAGRPPMVFFKRPDGREGVRWQEMADAS
jgi:hypothetical protein